MASTTKLSDEDFSFILSSIQRSVDVLRSPITSLEAKSLPPFPKSFSDVMAYGVMALKRMIKSLQHLPYFASLRFEDCNQLLRVRLANYTVDILYAILVQFTLLQIYCKLNYNV